MISVHLVDRLSSPSRLALGGKESIEEKLHTSCFPPNKLLPSSLSSTLLTPISHPFSFTSTCFPNALATIW